MNAFQDQCTAATLCPGHLCVRDDQDTRAACAHDPETEELLSFIIFTFVKIVSI